MTKDEFIEFIDKRGFVNGFATGRNYWWRGVGESKIKIQMMYDNSRYAPWGMAIHDAFWRPHQEVADAIRAIDRMNNDRW